MSKPTVSKQLAPVFVILAGSLWGLTGLFTKNLTAQGLTPAQIAFMRCATAAVLLWGYLLIFHRKSLKIQLRDVWMFLGTGVISLTLFSVLYFTSQQLVTLSIASVLLYTAPCFVMIMSAIFFKEKIGGRKITALFIALVGCAFTTGLVSSLFGGGLGGISTLGVVTGIGSGLGYAMYSIFGNVALKKYTSVTVTAYTFLFAALALAPFSIRPELPSLLLKGAVIRDILCIAVFSTIAPYLLYTLGLNYTEPGKASVMAFSEPVVATLVGVIVFHQEMTLSGIVGIAMIFVSIVILNIGKRAAPVQP